MNFFSLICTFGLASSAFAAPATTAPDDRCGYYFTTKTNGELTMAACRADVAKAKALIEGQGMDVNTPDAMGYTALDAAFHSSTVYWDPGYSPDMISFLLNQGADPNRLFVDGSTPLAHASYFTRMNIVTLLVDAGADVNLAGTRGTTPLRNAAVCDFRLSGGDKAAATTIQYLLAHGADITAKTSDGRSVLDAVPTPCSFAPDLCTPAKLPTAEWPTGSCKETYLLVKSTLEAAQRGQ